MNSKILLTIWLDNTYGCVNKCKYCYVSHKMIDKEKNFNYTGLIPFLNKYSENIFRIEIMGHEFYNQKELLKIVAILNKFNFTKNDIFLTTNSIFFYEKLKNKLKYTISFNGFSSINRNISQVNTNIVKYNLGKYFKNYKNIDKINWIIGDFNIDFLREDLFSLFLYLSSKNIDTKKIHIKFLLQKGIVYNKEIIKRFINNINNSNEILRKYFSTFGDMIRSNYSNIGKEPLEVTYCINRDETNNWYRCPWEIINDKYTLNIYDYMSGKTFACSNICSSNKGKVYSNNNIQFNFYQLLMRKVNLLNN